MQRHVPGAAAATGCELQADDLVPLACVRNVPARLLEISVSRQPLRVFVRDVLEVLGFELALIAGDFVERLFVLLPLVAAHR